MANQTIYPYGTGGTLPSNIGIINDLTTGGADKALSAEMGKYLGEVVTGEISIGPASIPSCGSRITSGGKWASTDVSTYYGGLVDVTAYRGLPYKIISSGGGSYAFTTAGVSLGNDVAFATGWNGYVLTPGAGTEYTGTVPADAVYLYVYLDSPGVTYRPQAIIFTSEDGLVPKVDKLTSDMYGTSEEVPINVAAITSCGGFIEADGTWSTQSTSTYYGGLVDVTQYRGRRVKIVSSGGGSYAFTKAGCTSGAAVQFASGWTARALLGESGSEYVSPIPDDAVYLFVYLDSPGTSYRPQSITILAVNSALQDIDDLWAEMANVHDEMTMAGRASKHIDVAALSSCGGFILADGTWSATGNDSYYGGLVPVTDFRGCGYKLVSSGGGSFAFVTSPFSKGDPVSFATGWTGRALFGDAGTEYTGTVPDDAVYLFVYLDSPGTTYRPREITFYVTIDDAIAEIEQQIAQGSVADSLSLMAWNLGHFSGGSQPNSTITADQYPEKVDGFRAVLSSERPDIYGLSEYSAIFGKNASNVNVNTKDELFNFEQTYFESTQMHYTCYAMFSGFGVPVYNVKINDYDCLADETISHTTLMDAQDFRYISADLYAFGVPIRLVVVHVAFDLNRPGVLTQKQFNELINKYANDDYVIIMGDFNVSDVSEYDTFVAAGYSLANDGRFLTYRTGGTPLDNIVVKGLSIFDAKMVTTSLSDHNALLCKITKAG